MNHPDEQQLWEYADGELSETEEKIIQQHVETCPTCSTTLVEILDFNTSCQAIVICNPSMRFSKNVMEKLEAEVTHYEPIFKWYWQMLGIGGFATLLVSLLVSACCCPKGMALPWGPNMKFLGEFANHFIYFLQAPSVILAVSLIGSFWTLFLVDRWMAIGR